MRRILSFMLFCFVSIHTLAAENNFKIQGYIRDAATGNGLAGANVSVEPILTGDASDEEGFFEVTVPAGNYQIYFYYVGYETVVKTMKIENNMKLIIEMQEEILEAETIVSVADRDDNVQSVSMSIAQINSETIKTVPVVLGEVDLIKTIQLLPGVSSVGEGTSGFNVRGGAADQNLVLLDGISVYNASHLFGFFSIFNSDATDDLTLYKGNMPAKYGGRLSSVLDIRQKDGNSKKHELKGGIGLISSRLMAEGPINGEKGSYVFAGRRSYGDLFLPLFNNNSTAFFYDLNFSGAYNFNSYNYLKVAAYFGRDKFEISDVFGNSWGNAGFSAQWRHFFSEKFLSNLTYSFSDYAYGLDILSDGSEFIWRAHVRNHTVQNNFSWFINDNNILEFGIGSIFYDFQPGLIQPDSENSSILRTELDKKYAFEPSAFISMEQTFSEKMSINYGVRFSSFFRTGRQSIPVYQDNAPVLYNPVLGRYENGRVISTRNYDNGDIISEFFGIEPRVTVKYAFAEDKSIKLGYNHTRQYLHLISNSTAPSPLDLWAPSGPFIEPQKADQFAVGYYQNFAESTYESSVEVYYKKMYNLVDYVDGAELFLNNNLETELLSGSGRAYGIEFYLKKKSGRFTGWISYTLSRSERKVTGLNELDPGINGGRYYPTSFDKLHDFSATGVYKLNKDWTLSANFVYTSGRPTTYPDSRYEYNGIIVTQYEDRNQERFPNYHRLDISATLHDKWGGDWVFSLYNVYNRMNASSITFRQNEDNPIVTEAVRTTIFGIVPSISYNFDL
jgi:hypothetical protein